MTTSITAPLAALTTIFTPPCSTSWLLTSTKDPSQYPPFPTNGPTSCDPPNWAANIRDKSFQFYSPAICPSGFEVGPGCQVKDERTAEGFPAIQPGETAVFCVPRWVVHPFGQNTSGSDLMCRGVCIAVNLVPVIPRIFEAVSGEPRLMRTIPSRSDQPYRYAFSRLIWLLSRHIHSHLA